MPGYGFADFLNGACRRLSRCKGALAGVYFGPVGGTRSAQPCGGIVILVLAITGGTGKYSAARGQMKLHARNEKGSEYDFVYELE